MSEIAVYSNVFAILELVLNMKTIIVKYVCISKLPGKHDVVFISWNENEIFNSANIFLTKHLFIIQLVFYTEFVFIILWILLSYLSVVLSVLDVFDMMAQICLCHIQHHLHTLGTISLKFIEQELRMKAKNFDGVFENEKYQLLGCRLWGVSQFVIKAYFLLIFR